MPRLHLTQLSQLKQQKYWFCTDKRRLCRVDSETSRTITGTRSIGGVQVQIPEERVEYVLSVTLPSAEIKGHVDKAEARQNVKILSSLVSNTEDEQRDDRVWQEVWAERAVPKIISPHGVPEPSDKDFEVQIYCCEIRDCNGVPVSPGAPINNSGLLNAGVTALSVDDDKIEYDFFATGQAAPVAVPAVEAVSVVAKPLVKPKRNEAANGLATK